MTEFTSDRLTELKAVAEAATEGPWQWMDGGVFHSTSFGWQPVTLPGESAQHIAFFDPPTVLALIAALEAKTAEVERHKRYECMGLNCDGGCSYNDGPQEECSLHGRNPRELWEVIGGLARERDEARAEVERITESRNEWASRMMELASETQRADRAEDAIERVRELHRKRRAYADDWDTCTCGYGSHPCPTIRALETGEGQ